MAMLAFVCGFLIGAIAAIVTAVVLNDRLNGG